MEIFRKLQQKLDTMSSGYPATESGIEIKILKKLFTESDAELFIRLSPMLETPEIVATRTGKDLDDIKIHLEDMAVRGLIFRQRKDGVPRYAAVPFVVGIFEFQVGRMDNELASMVEEYYDDAFGITIQSHKTPLMRTIPVNEQIVHKWPVAPYEDVIKILESQKKIALAPCVCRTTAHKAGKGCDKPVETCLLFGSHADYYIENKIGRAVTIEEAKKIVKQSDDAGLVMNPYNAQKLGGLCSCCGDCCGILKSLKRQKKPAEAVQSNYFAVVDESLCTACEVCIERCQMDAIKIDGFAVVDLDRCIGCGLCVTKCASESITLCKKEESELYVPPVSGGETYIRLAMERKVNPMPE